MDAKCAPAADGGMIFEGWVEQGSARYGARSGKSGARLNLRQGHGHSLFRQGCGDESSCAHSALEVPFGKQLGVGIENRKTGYSKFAGKLSAGGNPNTGTKIAAQDRRAKSIVDLLMKRMRRLTVDDNDRQCARGRTIHTSIIVVSIMVTLADMETSQSPGNHR